LGRLKWRECQSKPGGEWVDASKVDAVMTYHIMQEALVGKGGDQAIDLE
jgi:hypothetical protein